MKMAFNAITWSIWLARNDVIFKGNEWNGSNTFDLIKLQLAWWVKAKWSDLNPFFLDVIRFLDASLNPQKTQQAKQIERWQEPFNGDLEFSVDAAARGNPDRVSIQRVLRDDKGSILILFSILVGVMDPNKVELMALWKVFK